MPKKKKKKKKKKQLALVCCFFVLGQHDVVQTDIAKVSDACHESGALNKVIIETSLLTDEEKVMAFFRHIFVVPPYSFIKFLHGATRLHAMTL